MSAWEAEVIPHDAGAYARFLPQHLDDSGKKLQPNFFKARGRGMSTDWNRYAKPSDTRRAPTATKRPASDYGIAELSVKSIRDVDGMSVEHTPLPENRAHTDILGLSKDEVNELQVTIRREAMVTTVKKVHFWPGDPDRQSP